MDLVDQTQRTADAAAQSRNSKFVERGTSLQAGKLAETKTCTHPKWAKMFPDTITNQGLARRTCTVSTIRRLTTSGHIDSF